MLGARFFLLAAPTPSVLQKLLGYISDEWNSLIYYSILILIRNSHAAFEARGYTSGYAVHRTTMPLSSAPGKGRGSWTKRRKKKKNNDTERARDEPRNTVRSPVATCEQSCCEWSASQCSYVVEGPTVCCVHVCTVLLV